MNGYFFFYIFIRINDIFTDEETVFIEDNTISDCLYVSVSNFRQNTLITT